MDKKTFYISFSLLLLINFLSIFENNNTAFWVTLSLTGAFGILVGTDKIQKVSRYF